MRLDHGHGVGVLLACILASAPHVLHAQEAARPAARTFGLVSTVSHTIQALAFAGYSAVDTGNVFANEFGSRFCNAPNCAFGAPVSLPAGALVTRLELEACDDDAGGGSVEATLLRVTVNESAVSPLAVVGTGAPDAPGCQVFGTDLVSPETIENADATYVARVATQGVGSATRFQAVRIFYRLQQSPAPALATFGDVPTGHPFFAFVEAMVAAGITTGCQAAPPLYCPDDPVTRGQMAVFISRALGLHWAP